ncbi:TraB/GumN family protein [Dyella ginsengisoli]|uniref:TraB/GumN family protein n=1 Tax=Dyella ginsengisoli TaxID=363848 RepID=A0ABW8JQT7_9GAMM
MKSPLIARALVCLVLLLPTAILAKPALWVVKDADTTLYLFGTIHLLPKDADWHYPALDRALAQSDALVVEITDDNPANMTALVLRLGIDAAHPLSSLLSSGDFHRLDLAARKAGLPGTTALNVMRPWLATLTLTLAPLTKAGLDPARGVDRQLRDMMAKAGKPVRALETAEEQIHFLADMPTRLQLDMLRQTVHEADHASVELQALLDAWQAGDDAAIARLENELMKRETPALYQRLLVQRNAVWAGRIKAMLDTPGTVFIAVGAAHLAGPDSVQAQLQKLGISSARVPAM